jgi:hypothetical protein
LFACGGRELGGAEDTGGTEETTTTGDETGETGETGDDPPPQTGEVSWCVIWDETSQDDVPVDIELDSQGNIVVAGTANAHPHFNEGERWVAKFDPKGEHLWSFTAGEEGEMESLQEAEITSDDGIVVLGTKTEAGEFAPYLARFSPEGDETWTFEPGPQMVMSAMAIDESDELTVFGVDVGPDPMMAQPLVWKFDAADGQVTDQLPLDDIGKRAVTTAWVGQKIWVGGESFGGMPPEPPERNAWLARFDASFGAEVSVEFLPENQDAAETRAVAVAPDDSVWVTGVAWEGVPPDPPASSFDGWLLHFTNMGDLLEEVVLSEGSSAPQGGTDLAFDPWGNLAISGTAFDQGYVAKRSPEGDVLWTQTIQVDQALARSSVNALTLDADADVFLAGTGAEEGEFADAVICELAP